MISGKIWHESKYLKTYSKCLAGEDWWGLMMKPPFLYADISMNNQSRAEYLTNKNTGMS
jgi:hypothetical protein